MYTSELKYTLDMTIEEMFNNIVFSQCFEKSLNVTVYMYLFGCWGHAGKGSITELAP